MINDDVGFYIRNYIAKFTTITRISRSPLCLAIINDEEDLPKSLGKKRLMECKRPMRRLDEYTLICPAGHRKRNIAWEMKSFKIFYPKMRGLS